MSFDVIIIGAGPAGLSAGIFTRRAGLKTLCLERLAIGGQASLSYDISNYPGYNKISGFDLTNKFFEHAKDVGLELKFETVKSLKKSGKIFEVKTNDEIYKAKKVIIASGCNARKLGLDNEERLVGRGVSYCASCDGNFFKDKIVAIVGGGDTAFENVDYLSNLAKKIYLINRTEKFKAGENKLEKAKKYKNVEIITSAVVRAIKGDEYLTSINVAINNKVKTLDVDGLFIAIGQEPYLAYLDIDVDKDEYGYIVVDKNMKTSVDNLYACGDIISKNFKQVITACADGAIAGNSCIKR